MGRGERELWGPTVMEEGTEGILGGRWGPDGPGEGTVGTAEDPRITRGRQERTGGGGDLGSH